MDLDWGEDGYEDVVLKYRENTGFLATYSLESSVELDYEIKETGEKVHFERIDNIGFHYINGELIATTTYGNSNSRLIVSLPDDARMLSFKPGSEPNYTYDPWAGFSNYVASGTYDWHTKGLLEVSASAATTIILGSITGNLPAAVAAFVNLGSLASSLYTGWKLSSSYNSGELYAVDVIYNSHYVNCNILVQQGLIVYQMNKNYNQILQRNYATFKRASSHYWLANPNDYTQPTACRLITSDYPY